MTDTPTTKPWYHRRTVWAAASMVAVAIASVILELPGEKVAAIESALAAVALVFLRDGVETAARRGAVGAALVALLWLPGCCSYPDTRPTLRIVDRVLQRLQLDYDADSSGGRLLADTRATIAAAEGER